MRYQIIADESDFLIVHKPPGILVHGDEAGTLVELLREHCGDSELYPCHRLDKATSGLMLFAKGRDANANLSMQFQAGGVQKVYIALTHKKPSKKQGIIAGDMIKSRGGSWRLSRTMDRPAVTAFFSKAGGEGRRLILMKPLTGKTHQLRVALKSLGAPILGDERYNGNTSDRLYLHAYGLAFEFKGQPFHFLQAPMSGQHFTSSAFCESLNDMGDPRSLTWPDMSRYVASPSSSAHVRVSK